MKYEDFIYQAFRKFSTRLGSFHFKGDASYENVVWEDSVNPLPSKAEIEAEILKLQKEYEGLEYQRSRALEYPNITEYIDGVVKGDQAQIQAYIDACLAVKAKYPKPTE